ncbi:MAG: carbohydrate-binding domain-containing protein [Deltaproteobacteria bacterium]
MLIHNSNHIISAVKTQLADSLFFTDNESIMNLSKDGVTYKTLVSKIDSISFGTKGNDIIIDYKGDYAEIYNPFAFDGVEIEMSGADVIIKNKHSLSGINILLSGTSENGSFKLYSLTDCNILMNGVKITNPDGPAFNNQGNVKLFVTLKEGTTNELYDGSTYATAPNNSEGIAEDQKGVLFSEGELIFKGSGTLNITGTGSGKQGLSCDDQITFESGNINIFSAKKDGIHSNDGIVVNGGNIFVKASGDGMDGDTGFVNINGGTVTIESSSADVKAIACDSDMNISGGTIKLTVNGNQSKGLKSGKNIIISDGDITINTSGGVVLETSGSGYDPSYCTAIKSDSSVTISKATIKIISSGIAGKGISSDKNVNILSGNVTISTSGNGATYKNSSGVTDSYNATCITTDVDLNVIGGTLTASSSGSASKALSSDGNMTFGNTDNSPTVNLTTTGSKILISGSGNNADYAESKTIKSDGALTINNGNLTISSNDDGMKSETSITIKKGTINIIKSVEGIEAPFITVYDGNVSIVSSDDGFNATKGNGGESNDGSLLDIKNGYIVVSSSNGDGLDSNGNITMSGGTVLVHGPQSNPEVGMDFNGAFNISGGFLAVSGTNSNMTQAPNNTSTQYALKLVSSQQLSSSTLFHIQDSSGNDLLTFKPIRNYYSVIYSSNSLKNGASYSVYTGGSSTGTLKDGLYSGGVYSGGTLKKTFTISGKITNVSF